ncbi:hypothetical protein ATANTOWER_013244, partial [Ataeniobius toweri]|nr:hypothetical protein [Ataeniobius toweri]
RFKQFIDIAGGGGWKAEQETALGLELTRRERRLDIGVLRNGGNFRRRVFEGDLLRKAEVGLVGEVSLSTVTEASRECAVLCCLIQVPSERLCGIDGWTGR